VPNEVLSSVIHKLTWYR